MLRIQTKGKTMNNPTASEIKTVHAIHKATAARTKAEEAARRAQLKLTSALIRWQKSVDELERLGVETEYNFGDCIC